MAMMCIWIIFKITLKRTTEDLFKRENKKFLIPLLSFFCTQQNQYERNKHSWNNLRKQRVIFSSVTLNERHRIRFHRILIENNTISSFSCSFISSNLLFPFFTVKIIQCIKWSECFSKMWRRENVSQRKKQNFVILNRITYFSSFFFIRYTFSLSLLSHIPR